MLYKLTEWQTASEKWCCNCVDNLGQNSGAWWHPARILGITPAAFISLLLEEYKPDYFYYNKETGFADWTWNDLNKMRKFKNFINKKAREVNYQI